MVNNIRGQHLRGVHDLYNRLGHVSPIGSTRFHRMHSQVFLNLTNSWKGANEALDLPMENYPFEYRMFAADWNREKNRFAMSRVRFIPTKGDNPKAHYVTPRFLHNEKQYIVYYENYGVHTSSIDGAISLIKHWAHKQLKKIDDGYDIHACTGNGRVDSVKITANFQPPSSGGIQSMVGFIAGSITPHALYTPERIPAEAPHQTKDHSAQLNCG